MIALIVIMAGLGSYVPAEYASIKWAYSLYISPSNPVETHGRHTFSPDKQWCTRTKSVGFRTRNGNGLAHTYCVDVKYTRNTRRDRKRHNAIWRIRFGLCDIRGAYPSSPIRHFRNSLSTALDLFTIQSGCRHTPYGNYNGTDTPPILTGHLTFCRAVAMKYISSIKSQKATQSNSIMVYRWLKVQASLGK